MVAHCLNIDSSPIHSSGRLNNVLLRGSILGPCCLPARLPPCSSWDFDGPPPTTTTTTTPLILHLHTHGSLQIPPNSSSSPGQATKKKKKKAVDKVLSSGSAGTFLKKTTFAQSFAPFPHVEILKQAAVSLEKSKEMSLTQRSSCGFRLKLTFARRKQKFQ